MGSTNKHLSQILDLLDKHYPDAKIALNYGNTWELLVSVILSAQCTDIMVNKVTAKLFAKYPTLEDYVHANSQEFESDIRSTGFFRNKAKNILASARQVREKYSGEVPKTMVELLTLPGVARKTANIVLGNAYGQVEGIAVDTHVHRISQRLRLVDPGTIGGKKRITFRKNGTEILDYIKDADPGKIEQQLMQNLPRKEWFPLSYRIIDHGRALCKAQNPNCQDCFLNKLCPASRA